jgi:hypothetical protein
MNWPRLIGDILVAFLLVMLIAAVWSDTRRAAATLRSASENEGAGAQCPRPPLARPVQVGRPARAASQCHRR